MTPIVCVHTRDCLELYRQGSSKIVGTVKGNPFTDDPEIEFREATILTFNDFEIIMDNWNQLEEHHNKQHREEIDTQTNWSGDSKCWHGRC